MTTLFHRHTFNPSTWMLVCSTAVLRYGTYDLEGNFVPLEQPVPRGHQRVYSNTCLKCGDLVFRRVKEIE